MLRKKKNKEVQPTEEELDESEFTSEEEEFKKTKKQKGEKMKKATNKKGKGKAGVSTKKTTKKGKGKEKESAKKGKATKKKGEPVRHATSEKYNSKADLFSQFMKKYKGEPPFDTVKKEMDKHFPERDGFVPFSKAEYTRKKARYQKGMLGKRGKS